MIGLKTEPLLEEARDQLSALDLVEKDPCSDRKIQGIIRSAVIPRIRDLNVSWVQSDENPGNGLCVLRVPPQSEDTKPFLIAQVVEERPVVKQIVFGYATRTKGNSEPMIASRLQRALKEGMNNA